MSALSKFSAISRARAALFLPEAAIFLRRIRFAEEKAVSVAEQTADRVSRRIIINMSI